MRTLLAFFMAASLQAQPPTPVWKFAVSGDSRNCGGVVMPAIAAGVKQAQAEFYWHLGDFRALYTFDEDLVPPASLQIKSKPLLIADYLSGAWPDFIREQLQPFGDLPVYLAVGNHETIPPATRDAWLIQFADWLEQPPLRAQRLSDDPLDHKLHTYYHWISRGIDFITLDNASFDQFDVAQLAWLHTRIAADEASRGIQTIVVGMHAALPGSVGRSHSMDDWAQGQQSGREAYEMLLHAQNTAGKRVYILCSHSHFYMDHVYDTPDWAGRVIPGWIVGTAGAVRYKIPLQAQPGNHGQTNVYGYMVGTVMDDNSITFSFQQLSEADLTRSNPGRPRSLVHWCYEENHQ